LPLEEIDSPTILHVRAAGDPAMLIGPVRELVRKLAPGYAIREINLLRDEVERSLWRERLVAQLAIGFAVIAGFLAAIGLYGTLAYYVSRNRRSIGIRMAIGAARANIVQLLAGRVARLIVAGLVLGVAASFGVSSWVRSLLSGVSAADPVSLGLAFLLIGGVAAVAALLPAWRATRIDPVVALREE
jgi:ABC-type antimicrobial peptide transport system permease subunit